MTEYSFKFKKKIVTKYLNGDGSYAYLANKYNIPCKKNIRIWVNNYKDFGEDALICSQKKEKYTFERKLLVV